MAAIAVERNAGLSPPDAVDRFISPCLPGICGLCRTGETRRRCQWRTVVGSSAGVIRPVVGVVGSILSDQQLVSLLASCPSAAVV